MDIIEQTPEVKLAAIEHRIVFWLKKRTYLEEIVNEAKANLDSCMQEINKLYLQECELKEQIKQETVESKLNE